MVNPAAGDAAEFFWINVGWRLLTKSNASRNAIRQWIAPTFQLRVTICSIFPGARERRSRTMKFFFQT